MTIIEAIRSGKAFRLKDWSEDYGYIHCDHMGRFVDDQGFSHCFYDFQILADDWEVREE